MKKEKTFEEALEKYETETSTYKITIPGTPINYLRERSGRNHFYNPRGKELRSVRKLVLEKLLTKTEKEKLKSLVEDESKTYYVSLKIEYYVPMRKNLSKEMQLLQKNKFIRPDIRPDLDNYDKFLLDMFHSVLYDDDKRVVSIQSDKYYDDSPRTEISVFIWEIRKIK